MNVTQQQTAFMQSAKEALKAASSTMSPQQKAEQVMSTYMPMRILFEEAKDMSGFFVRTDKRVEAERFVEDIREAIEGYGVIAAQWDADTPGVHFMVYVVDGISATSKALFQLIRLMMKNFESV